MTDQSAARPPIHLLETEADLLYDLALSQLHRDTDAAALLRAEIERAEIHAPGTFPATAIAMNSHIAFVDEGNGQRREVQLVWPQDADIAQGRVSILTPVGAGLIGLSQGQGIDWPDRDGKVRRLRIERVNPGHG